MIGTVRAVIFDFDGTLADSYPGITASVNYVRSQHGLTPLQESAVRPYVGRGPAYLLAHTVPGGDPEKDLRSYRTHHPSVMYSGTRLLPGVADALAALKRNARRTAVCSNKPVAFTRALLAHFSLAALLDVVLGPEDVPRPKPAPDMLQVALSRLETPPEAALYIGDMVVDIETARAAGVAVWVVPTGSDGRENLEAARPDCILKDLRELPTCLQLR